MLLERWAVWVRQDGRGKMGYGAPMACLIRDNVHASSGDVEPLGDDLAIVVDRALNVLKKGDWICYQALLLYYVDKHSMQYVGNIIYKEKKISSYRCRIKASEDVRNGERWLNGFLSCFNEFENLAA
ncbi:hypothetical protein [Catenovulum sediminis]|uniref:Antitermination protein Q n=1 Tax=Catenovulum sediminis TaxID=1740262 RepID=A0ABV1RKB1_9ALTE